MDETVEDEGTLTTVGQQLREAREAKGLTVEDVAAATRIPTRHLTSLEESAWDKLPAATYSIGFAKNYAGAVGLDRAAIGDQLRAEMGGALPPAPPPIEYLEVADPKRSFPKGLVFGALALLVLAAVGLVWVNERQLQADAASNAVAENNVVAAPQPTNPAPVAAQPVTLTATDAVWLQIKDGQTTLKQGEMQAGETFAVPANAASPILMTGKPEALRISVGDKIAAPIGPAGRRVKDVSLKGADLLAASLAPAPAATAAPTAAPPTRQTAPRSPAARPAGTPANSAPAAPSTTAMEPAQPAADAPGPATGAN
nr:helix-turn-helix domain-containing protein [uncultured Sphingomonas sp.]